MECLAPLPNAGPGAGEAIAAARGTGMTVNRANRGMLLYAEAVLPVWSDLARMLTARAALADGRGAPRRWLTSAARTFGAAGLEPLIRHCHALLAAPAPGSLSSLGVTARETEILDLVAAGLANKDIAARLHLSHRTVARRGAAVSGLDATASLLDIARERVPGASLTVADLEDPLPYPEGAFNVVTSFNAVQFAVDPVAALKHMSHVTRPGGLISFLVWGPPEKCQSGVLFAELGPLMPPAPAAAPSSVAWSEDGQLDELAARAGLNPLTVADVPNPLIYPDLATAVRTQLSSGPARKAIQHSGLPAVRGALTRAFAGSRRPGATYRQENIFRYLVARAG